MQRKYWLLVIGAILIGILFTLLKITIADELLFPPLIATGVIHVGKPLPAHSSKSSSKGFETALLACNRRNTVEAYRRYGHRSPLWDVQAISLLEDYAQYTTGIKGAPSSWEMLPKAQAVLAKGCQDPLILYIYGRTIAEQQGKEYAIPALERAVAGFATSHYRKASACRARVFLHSCYSVMGVTKTIDATKVRQNKQLTIQWEVESLHDGSYTPKETRIALYYLNSNFLTETFSHDLLRLLKRPRLGIDPYITKFYEAETILDIPDEVDWKTRNEQQRRARRAEVYDAARLLQEAYALHPDYPEAPARLITIKPKGYTLAMSRKWFDRAVADEFDYQPAYEAYINMLRSPFGSHRAMYQFALECLRTRRYDTIVPTFYPCILELIDMDGDSSYWQRDEVYPNLKAFYLGMANAEPKKKYFAKSKLALIAWHYHDLATARRMFDEIGDHLVRVAFSGGKTRDLHDLREELFTQGTALTKPLQQADAVDAAQGPQAALAIYQGLLAQSSPAARIVLQERMAGLRNEVRFRNGAWVDFANDPRAWRIANGTWTTLPDGSIVSRGGEAQRYIFLHGHYGARVEMRGEIDFVDVAHDIKQSTGAGFELGASRNTFIPHKPTKQQPAEGTLSGNSIAAVLNTNPKDELWVRASDNAKSSSCYPDVSSHNILHVYLWDSTVSIVVNGKLVQKAIHVSDTVPSSESTVGLFCNHNISSPGDIVFRHVQFRRLTRQPTFPVDAE